MIGSDTFGPDINGAAKFTAQLAAGLARRGHSVTVVAPAADSSEVGYGSELHEGEIIAVHRLKSSRLRSYPWVRFARPWFASRSAARILDDLQPDLVHHQSHIIVGRALIRHARKRGLPVVGTNHLMPENVVDAAGIPSVLRALVVRYLWRSARRSFLRSDVVTTPTRIAAEYLSKSAGIEDVRAISCGTDVGAFLPQPALSSSTDLVYVGRLSKEKNLEVLIRAFSHLDSRLGATLSILGDGDELQCLQDLVVELGLQSTVTFFGATPQVVLRHRLSMGVAFVMPSTAELQSIATLEAMASGLPIIAARAMALPHLVDHGVNGYLFTPGDEDDLARRLEQILTLPGAEYLAMKAASLELVREHGIERTIEQFEGIYRTLLDSRKASPTSPASPNGV
ncbi:glycosyltransferase [Microbacterium sp. EST19A]|uniref:glycosyltransferase n=1 Tax=Microbacterium sp. EST19A TaxID=2862681 RepID=UPI001CBFC17B|nr:glycosyltransferase [Microbacterium sp. EST19A]